MANKKYFHSSFSASKDKVNTIENQVYLKIKQILKTGLFKKIYDEVKDKEINNSYNSDIISQGLSKGTIFYSRKQAGFNLSRASSKERIALVNEYGKTIDDRNSFMYIGTYDIKPQHLLIIESFEAKRQQRVNLLSIASSAVLSNFLKKDFKVLFEKQANDLYDVVEKDFTKETKGVEIKETFGTQFKSNIDELAFVEKEKAIQEYLENLNIKIKGMAQDEITSLRKKVVENISNDKVYTELTNQIQTQYNISHSRANLIAKQETKLFITKREELNYAQIGVFKFKWLHPFPNKETSRPYHVFLAQQSKEKGVVYDSRTPPVDPQTGKSIMPSSEINCHCVALWVVEEVVAAK